MSFATPLLHLRLEVALGAVLHTWQGGGFFMSAADWPVEVNPLYKCWHWHGKKNRDGYGVVWPGPRMAHRVVFEAEEGPITGGKELDHLCRRRDCVNPRHMEAITRSEQERRKLWRNRVRRLKACPRGHRLTLRTQEGGMLCRECS